MTAKLSEKNIVQCFGTQTPQVFKILDIFRLVNVFLGFILNDNQSWTKFLSFRILYLGSKHDLLLDTSKSDLHIGLLEISSFDLELFVQFNWFGELLLD